MNRKKYRTSDEMYLEYYTKHPTRLKSYLATALEEYQKDGDEKAFLTALAFAAKVQGGFSKVSKNTGLNRENLYRALSKHGDPRLSTFMLILSTLGYRLQLV